MVLSYNSTLAEALSRASAFLEQAGKMADLTTLHSYWSMTFGWSYTRMILERDHVLDKGMIDRFNQVLDRLVQDEPIQYIVGQADFGDLSFFVTPDTLIPREDSYGLISQAQSHLRDAHDYRILDIGTGTGVLAITLKTLAPQAQVVGLDISKPALEVAKSNSQRHQVAIDWRISDVFSSLDPQKDQFDLIVSNPPYISLDEQGLMDQSVIKYEPAIALYADDHGLAIYKRIAKDLGQYLKPQGLALFEIGFQQGKQVQSIFSQALAHAQVQIHQDLNGHDRYISVKREDPI